MRYAILINAVSSTLQLAKLAQRFQNGPFDIYVHLNKNADLQKFDDVLNMPHVFPVKDDIIARSGGYSKIRATLACLRQILDSEILYSNITLISGRDYPIKTTDDLVAFYKQHPNDQLISFSKNWYKEHWGDFDRNYLTDLGFSETGLVAKLINMVIGKPKLPKNLKIVGGSPYWTLTPDCAKYVADYIKRYNFEHIFKYVKNTDKFLFQSVVMHSSFKNSVIDHNYHFSQNAKDSRQKYLSVKDMKTMMASDCLFAGRFDIGKDEQIFALIDDTVHKVRT